jgi:hypothetical protein
VSQAFGILCFKHVQAACAHAHTCIKFDALPRTSQCPGLRFRHLNSRICCSLSRLLNPQPVRTSYIGSIYHDKRKEEGRPTTIPSHPLPYFYHSLLLAHSKRGECPFITVTGCCTVVLLIICDTWRSKQQAWGLLCRQQEWKMCFIPNGWTCGALVDTPNLSNLHLQIVNPYKYHATEDQFRPGATVLVPKNDCFPNIRNFI